LGQRLFLGIMAPVTDLGMFGTAFIEASASLVLLVVYCLLRPLESGRFFRYWLIGWSAYVVWGVTRIVWRVGGYADMAQINVALSLLAWALLFVAIVESEKRAWPAKLLYPICIATCIGVYLIGAVLANVRAERWVGGIAEASLNLASAWILWKTRTSYRGVGWKVLSVALLLRGLNGLDRGGWHPGFMNVFRMSSQGILGIAAGVGMAILVLEASRTRTGDLNEKLRRLALIAAQAMQSLKVNQTMGGILRHLVESLGASHGVIYLFDDPINPSVLVLRAATGLNEASRREYARVNLTEPWVQRVLAQESPVISVASAPEHAVDWTSDLPLASLIMIRIPGKDTPLGVLGIGSALPAGFHPDQEEFFVNVANLLGLTVQNITLFESAATSRRQWLDTFDSIDDLILVHSEDGRLLRANRALAARLGTDPQSLHKKLLREVFRQGEESWKSCPYCEGVAGKPEKRDQFFNGFFLASDSAFHNSDGRRLGTIHVLKDLTSRLQAETKFRTLFEKVQEGVFIATLEGKLVDFNDAFMRILGYESREELLGEEMTRLYVDPADRGRLMRLMREYGEVSNFEFQFRRRDGEIRTANESSFVTRDETGAAAAYEGFLLDITEHKQAEMGLRRRNRELLALNSIGELLGQGTDVDAALSSVLPKLTKLLTADTGVVYRLDQTSQTLKLAAADGYPQGLTAEFSNMPFPAPLMQQLLQTRPAVLSGSAPALPEALRELNRLEGMRASQVAILWSKDRVMGVLMTACREARALSTEETSLLCAVASQMATTIDKAELLQETQEAYQSLRHAQEQLLQSEKMAAVGQLISGVAHELNNPLTAILGYTQLLKSGEVSAGRSPEFIEKVHKQAQRTHRIVENLLSFGRQHKPERKTVQLNQILEDTLTLREYDMRGRNIAVHREFDPRLPETYADFHQLQQVFLNILNNAVDAIREHSGSGEIWIRTQQTGKQLQVEFTDSGPGVQNPTRIFDPFYTTKAVGKGTGLGLSICYGIIKEHGGEIQVHNSPPRGATFTIVLPLAPAESGYANGDLSPEAENASPRYAAFRRD
jgi:PAS domain S-box-containing protein